jgi:hypothetical protein
LPAAIFVVCLLFGQRARAVRRSDIDRDIQDSDAVHLAGITAQLQHMTARYRYMRNESINAAD